MPRIFQTIIGRLTILSVAFAVLVGAFWSWRSSPLNLVPIEYFVTVSPESSNPARGQVPFDVGSAFHRSLLVSGPLPLPFGAMPMANEKLIERDNALGFSNEVNDKAEKERARLYSSYCGFLDEPRNSEIARDLWKETLLCDTAHLKGDLVKAALEEFHGRVDAEIRSYRMHVAKNIGEKMGTSLIFALGIIVLTATGMWIVKGHVF